MSWTIKLWNILSQAFLCCNCSARVSWLVYLIEDCGCLISREEGHKEVAKNWVLHRNLWGFGLCSTHKLPDTTEIKGYFLVLQAYPLLLILGLCTYFSLILRHKMYCLNK